MAGRYTAELGRRLYARYRDTRHAVYYDHGRPADPHVCQPTPFFARPSAATTLSYVDLAIVDEANGRVELLVEIEESGAEPKKIVGDVVNLALADGLRIQGRDYPLREIPLLLGLRTPPAGRRAAKARALCRLIAERLAAAGRTIDLTPIAAADGAGLIQALETEIDARLRHADA